MKKLYFILALIVTLITTSSCVQIIYPSGGLDDELDTENASQNETLADTSKSVEETEAHESASDNTMVTTVTEILETEPQITTSAETAPEETATAETKPIPKETEEQTPSILLMYLTSPISSNKKAFVEIKGKPNTEYDIKVIYSTTESSAQGLENKISDDDGFVSWEWKIGPSVKPNRYTIRIIGGGETFETLIQVE